MDELVEEKLGISSDDIELYGKYKAKIAPTAVPSKEIKSEGTPRPCYCAHPYKSRRGQNLHFCGPYRRPAAVRQKCYGGTPGLSRSCVWNERGAAGGGYAQVVPMSISTFILQVTCMPLALPTIC